MAGAFVDGALKGFNMMERHQSRMFNEERSKNLDERNDQRYQQQQGRLADMDKRDEERYQAQQGRLSDLDKERVANREQDVKWRESQGEQAEEQRSWSRNYQNQQAQWQKDQQAIPIAWQSFRQTGQIPDDLSDVLERNKGMDPRTYLNPEYREQVKGLGEKLDSVIKTGKMGEANSPETVQLFNNVFKDKIQASVGQYDEDIKSKIVGVDFAGFVPVEEKGGRVGLVLKVTYENGSQEVKPMTKGRSSDGDDPVMTYTPKELIGTVKARVMMADMMERPEYWDQMGAQVGASFQRSKTQGSNNPQAEYRKQLNSIQDEMTKALAKIEGGSDLDYLDEGGREKAIQRVKSLYQNRINQLQQSYGQSPASNDSQQKQSSADLDSLSDDELLQQLTGAIGAQ